MQNFRLVNFNNSKVMNLIFMVGFIMANKKKGKIYKS